MIARNRAAVKGMCQFHLIGVLLLLLVEPRFVCAQDYACQTQVSGAALTGCQVDLPLWFGDQATVPASIIRKARLHLETIYLVIGVRLVWRENLRDLPRPFVVLVVPDTRATAFQVRDLDALGVTWQAHEGGGMAFVFYGRVEHAASNNRVEVAKVLGAVLAHEIGHAVLAAADKLDK